jgi:hypothetical protein
VTSLPVHVHVGSEKHRHDGRILNIGGGGVLLRTDHTLETNDQVSLDFDLKGEKKPITLPGVVIRNDARGLGVAFVRVSDVTAELIAYLVKRLHT